MFKKTVSIHEVFLQRLAVHPVLRNDNNFQVFLEYKGDVRIRLINEIDVIDFFVVKCTRQEC